MIAQRTFAFVNDRNVAIDRRKFLATITNSFFGLLALQVSDISWSSPALAEAFYAAGYRDGKRREVDTVKYFLAVRKLSAKETELIPVQNDVHSVVQNPKHLQMLVGVAKDQDQLTVFPSISDFKDKVLVKASPGMMFSGHGCFNLDGSIFVTSETDPKTETGLLCIRDGRTLKVLDIIPSGGVYPHEMKFLDQDKVLAVANGGFEFKNTNFCFIDMSTHKVIESHAPPKSGPGVRHFAMSDQGEFLTGSWSRYGSSESKMEPAAELMFGKRGIQGHLSISAPDAELAKKFKGQASQYLSILWHKPTNSVIATVTSADVVVISDMSTGKVKQVLQKKNPTGSAICSDENLVVISDGSGKLQFLDMISLDWRHSLEIENTRLTGSHMTIVRPA